MNEHFLKALDRAANALADAATGDWNTVRADVENDEGYLFFRLACSDDGGRKHYLDLGLDLNDAFEAFLELNKHKEQTWTRCVLELRRSGQYDATFSYSDGTQLPYSQ